MPPGEAVRGGVSSFGYAGTIAHAGLHHTRGDGATSSALSPFVCRRRAFPWREASSSSDAERTSMYSACWVAATRLGVTPSRPCLLLTASGAMVANGAPSIMPPWYLVAVLLACYFSSAPLLHVFFFIFSFIISHLPPKSVCCLQAMLACMGTLPYPVCRSVSHAQVAKYENMHFECCVCNTHYVCVCDCVWR